MDDQVKSLQEIVNQKMEHFGRDKTFGTVEKVKELLANERFKHTN